MLVKIVGYSRMKNKTTGITMLSLSINFSFNINTLRVLVKMLM